MFYLITGDILRQVTQYISNSPSALSSSLPFDEVSLVAKISRHVAEKSPPSLVATSSGNNNNSPTKGSTSATTNNETLFANLYDELKASVRFSIIAYFDINNFQFFINIIEKLTRYIV